MASLNDPDVRILVRISKDTNQGRFDDALIFTKDEYDALTNQQVKDLATARKDAWLEMMREAKRNPRRITKAEKIAAKEALAATVVQMEEEIANTPDDPLANQAIKGQ